MPSTLLLETAVWFGVWTRNSSLHGLESSLETAVWFGVWTRNNSLVWSLDSKQQFGLESGLETTVWFGVCT